jgi:hypothetical protein
MIVLAAVPDIRVEVDEVAVPGKIVVMLGGHRGGVVTILQNTLQVRGNIIIG